MHKVVPFVSFAVGTIVGSAVSWYVLKEKYAQLAQEEIDSVKEVFSGRGRKERVDKAVNKIENACKEQDEKNVDIKKYATKLGECDYTDYSEVELVEKAEAPYVISPDEFGELDDYEQISLTYYADKVLVDENDEAVETIDKVVGFDSLTHFGEYEDDSVFVRNDRLKSDFEILLDHRNYLDVVKDKLSMAEVE